MFHPAWVRVATDAPVDGSWHVPVHSCSSTPGKMQDGKEARIALGALAQPSGNQPSATTHPDEVQMASALVTALPG